MSSSLLILQPLSRSMPQVPTRCFLIEIVVGRRVLLRGLPICRYLTAMVFVVASGTFELLLRAIKSASGVEISFESRSSAPASVVVKNVVVDDKQKPFHDLFSRQNVYSQLNSIEKDGSSSLNRSEEDELDFRAEVCEWPTLAKQVFSKPSRSLHSVFVLASSGDFGSVLPRPRWVSTPMSTCSFDTRGSDAERHRRSPFGGYSPQCSSPRQESAPHFSDDNSRLLEQPCVHAVPVAPHAAQNVIQSLCSVRSPADAAPPIQQPVSSSVLPSGARTPATHLPTVETGAVVDSISHDVPDSDSLENYLQRFFASLGESDSFQSASTLTTAHTHGRPTSMSRCEAPQWGALINIDLGVSDLGNCVDNGATNENRQWSVESTRTAVAGTSSNASRHFFIDPPYRALTQAVYNMWGLSRRAVRRPELPPLSALIGRTSMSAVWGSEVIAKKKFDTPLIPTPPDSVELLPLWLELDIGPVQAAAPQTPVRGKPSSLERWQYKTIIALMDRDRSCVFEGKESTARYRSSRLVVQKYAPDLYLAEWEGIEFRHVQTNERFCRTWER
jgi:hypothetical protein